MLIWSGKSKEYYEAIVQRVLVSDNEAMQTGLEMQKTDKDVVSVMK